MIKESMKNVRNNLHKFRTYLVYLTKLGYDLAIGPALNVSLNPGFESIIGVL